MNSGKKVLIVDDENEIVSFLETYLMRFGIESIKAIDGKTAVNIYKKENISCVFLDLNMFDMDGYEVLKKITIYDPRAKVIIITGVNDETAKIKTIKLGAVDFLHKPIDLGELKSKVDKYANG